MNKFLAKIFHLQFYCHSDKEYNDLATIFFNTQVIIRHRRHLALPCHFVSYLFVLYPFNFPTEFWNSVQDDAIRNLFSAKTIHEYSAQSLLTFLVRNLISHSQFPFSWFLESEFHRYSSILASSKFLGLLHTYIWSLVLLAGEAKMKSMSCIKLVLMPFGID